jgi:hypothetical protein
MRIAQDRLTIETTSREIKEITGTVAGWAKRQGIARGLFSCSLSRGRARFSVPRRRMVQAVGCAGQETGPEDAG